MNLLVFITPQITKSRRSEKGYLYFDSGNKSCSAPPPSWSSGVLYLLFEAWVRGTGEVLEPDSAPLRQRELCSCVATESSWPGTSQDLLGACDGFSSTDQSGSRSKTSERETARCIFFSEDVVFPPSVLYSSSSSPSVQVRLLPTDDRWEKSRLTRETISSSSLFSVHPGLHDPSFTGSPVFCLFSPPFGIGN